MIKTRVLNEDGTELSTDEQLTVRDLVQRLMGARETMSAKNTHRDLLGYAVNAISELAMEVDRLRRKAA